jgi:CRISPR-associated protein Cas1
MLNYAYTVALGQCTRAIIGMGLDPCMGFLHSPKPGRLSLSYDVLELHRARLTQAVFEHVAGQIFKRADFELSVAGVVSLSPHVARSVAALALKEIIIKDYVGGVKRVAAWF